MTAAVLAAMASGVSVAAFFLGLFSDESCPSVGASLARIQAQPNVPFLDFLEQANASTEGYGSTQLKRPVNAIFADLAIEGYRGDHLTLKWSMLNADTGRIVQKRALRNRPALDIEPSTCTTRLRASVWTPVDHPGDRRVTLTIVDEAGHVLAEGRTPRL